MGTGRMEITITSRLQYKKPLFGAFYIKNALILMS
jgi:hypothetical protein